MKQIVNNRKERVKITILPCVAYHVVYNNLEIHNVKKPRKESLLANYWGFAAGGMNFIESMIPILEDRLPKIFNFFSFDITFVKDVQKMKKFEFTAKDTKKSGPVIEFEDTTADFLQELYQHHSRGPTKDTKKRGLARRVCLVFWGLYGLESHRLEEAGTPYMWTNALRALFNYYSKSDEKKEVFLGWFVHEFAHTFGLDHHEGKECTMKNENYLMLCDDCLSKVQAYTRNNTVKNNQKRR